MSYCDRFFQQKLNELELTNPKRQLGDTAKLTLLSFAGSVPHSVSVEGFALLNFILR